MKKNNLYIAFAILGAGVVLWQLLGSGYVLTLDMVFGSHINLVRNAGDLLNTAPTWHILAWLTVIFNGWITQKILLITIFFLLFYFPLRFFKKIFSIENTGGAEYVVSLFFAINPFVYERFLAGQWTVIFGYLLLIPLTVYLAEFCRTFELKKSWREDWKLLVTLMVLGAVSLHVFIMAILVIALTFAVVLIYSGFKYEGSGLGISEPYNFLKKCLFLGLAVLVCSSYWLIPAVIGKATSIANFGPAHWEAFKTAGSGNFGTLGHVVTLYGFWSEHEEEWPSRFVLFKDAGWVFVMVFMALLAIIVTGIYAGLKDKKLRGMVAWLVVVVCLAIVFSCGVGEGVFRPFNLWLFEHISFWKGFRDSEKWSALVALAYALLAGLGARFIFSRLKKAADKRAAMYVIIALPLIYTPTMLFGLVYQLNVVHYPTAWAQANDMIKQEPNCRALFLPWHEYYSLRFNNSLLTANAARNYFDCDIVAGKNMELGSIVSQGGNGAEYDLIEPAVMDNEADPDVVISLLKTRGLKYIIFTNDIQDEDPYLYPFLASKKIRLVGKWLSGVYLYKIL